MLITLTTDFGRSDSYVAQMKGVILSLNPKANIIDLSHELPRYSITAAARFLREASPHFPEETIHVVVIDPTVGSDRLPILLRTPIVAGSGTRRQSFVGPDNGIFSLLHDEKPLREVWDISVAEFRDLRRSYPTFDGRNLFAPTAAYLSLGRRPEELSKKRSNGNLGVTISESKPQCIEGILEGEILFFDSYGNASSNITREDLSSFSSFHVEVENGISLPFVRTFSDVEPQEGASLLNSQDTLELVVYLGDAKKSLGLEEGMKLRVIPQCIQKAV